MSADYQVHGDVAVGDELPCLVPRRGESESIDNVVESKLEKPEEMLTGDIGPALGLLEREDASALNAALLSVSRAVVHGFDRALADNGLSVRAFLTQNDGTLMSAEQAVRFPILTVGSGPTNSMRGACALAGLSDALVTSRVTTAVVSASSSMASTSSSRPSTAPWSPAAAADGLSTTKRSPIGSNSAARSNF